MPYIDYTKKVAQLDYAKQTIVSSKKSYEYT